LNALASVIEDHTPTLSAHERREDEIVEAVGIVMPRVLKKFCEKVPFVKIKYPDLAVSTIRHLLPTPHMGRGAATQYKNFVEVRLAKGSNASTKTTLLCALLCS
jgi:hypothetical protein